MNRIPDDAPPEVLEGDVMDFIARAHEILDALQPSKIDALMLITVTNDLTYDVLGVGSLAEATRAANHFLLEAMESSCGCP